jgi:Tol biopolymer transport system component
MSLYLKNTSGLGAEGLFLQSASANPMDWSPDGQVVLVDLLRASPPGIYAMAMAGDHQPKPMIVVPGATAMQGQFSPDGRWIAYASNESGQSEIYLSPYPATGGKWQVSEGGGDSPRWNRSGKELFYLSPAQEVMAVPVTLGAGVQAGKPQRLFQAAIRPRGTSDFFQYDVAPDGRFLVVTLREAAVPLHVVVNWPSLLREP